MSASHNKDIFIKSLLAENVKLPANKINKNYKDVILQELKNKIEGKCTKHGYIKNNSVEISSIQAGTVEMASLNGNMIFQVKFYAEVCNPVVGSVVKCIVTNINKFGILAEVKPVLEIIIAKNTVGIKSEIDLDNIKIGDYVFVEVVGKKYELGDARISIVGRIVTQPSAFRGKKALKNLQMNIQADVQEDEEAGVDDAEDVESIEEEEADQEADPDAEGDEDENDEFEVNEDNEDFEEDDDDNQDANKKVGGGFFESDQEEDDQYEMFGGEDGSEEEEDEGSGHDD